eukprot:Em0009g993a
MSEQEKSCEAQRLDAQDSLRYLSIAMARRVSFYKTSCKGVPGIVYPLDPIHTSSHRIVYLVAYGAVAGEVVNLILDSASGDTSGGIRSIWASSLIRLLNVLEASVIYLPLFACVDAPIPVVGYLTGTLFVPLLFSRQIVSLDVVCHKHNDTDYEFQLADDLTFTLPILIFLSIMFVWYLVSAVREFHRLIVTPHSLVKAEVSVLANLLDGMEMVTPIPIKAPQDYPPYMGAQTIECLLTVTLAFSTVTLSIFLGKLYDSAKEFSSKLDINSTVITKALDYGADALYAFRAFVWNLVILMLLVRTVRIPVLYSLILNYGELLLVKLLFVGDTDNRHTVLRNRRLFYFFSYFVFFQNVVIGLVSSLLRIIYSMVLGLVLFFRLERVVLMKGFEALDQGHVTYVSFLYLEHTQNNSILMVFKDIFVELTNNTGSHPEMKELSDGPKERLYHSYNVNTFHRAPLSKRARNRWLVAYTLLRNPTLQPLRARSYDLVDKK